MAVSKRLRFEIFRRDNHACRYCGGTAPDVKLTIDHVTPIALGGKDEPGNLVTACADCNGGKTSTSPDSAVVEDVAQDAVKWAAAVKRAAEIANADKTAMVKYRNAFKRCWNSYSWGEGGKYTNRMPDDWARSVESFRQAGLPIDHLKEAVDVACNNGYITEARVFRYMCGVAWNKVEQIREIASSLIEAEAK